MNSNFMFEKEKVYKVNMNDDKSVSSRACESLDNCQSDSEVQGKWLGFYDQAFKVELDNGLRFLTNWRYSVKEYVTSEPLKIGLVQLKSV